MPAIVEAAAADRTVGKAVYEKASMGRDGQASLDSGCKGRRDSW